MGTAEKLFFDYTQTIVTGPVKQNKLSFSSVEINKLHFMLQPTVFPWSDSSSKANFICWHKSDAWSHLEQRVVSPE